MALWNGQELSKDTPSLGFTLASALLIPSFVRQALETAYVYDTANTQVTPLDDIKQWMREDPWRAGELFGELSDVLLGEEKKARKVAEKAGVEFDVVGFELEQMSTDDTYESLTPEWAARCYELAIDEADAFNAWSRRANVVDLALAVSFQLPDPGKHSLFSREQIAAALASLWRRKEGGGSRDEGPQERPGAERGFSAGPDGPQRRQNARLQPAEQRGLHHRAPSRLAGGGRDHGLLLPGLSPGSRGLFLDDL